MSYPAESNTPVIPMDPMAAPTPLFRTRAELPVAIQLVDAAQRIEELESELRKTKRASSYQQREAHEERLKLRLLCRNNGNGWTLSGIDLKSLQRSRDSPGGVSPGKEPFSVNWRRTSALLANWPFSSQALYTGLKMFNRFS